jgi:hypothetical protein
MEYEKVPVTFTKAELWVLLDFIRHAASNYPCEELNEQLRMAVLACEEGKLSEYTILLDKESIDAIDWNIRSNIKTPEVSGKVILLKAYKAQRILQLGFPDALEGDKSYSEVQNASNNDNTSNT